MPSATNNGHNTPGAEFKAPATNSTTANDPFASQRNDGSPVRSGGGSSDSPTAGSPTDRRFSAEWDASKTPPSQFQKRKGSFHATPASRDSHVDRYKDRDSKFHEVADSMKKGLFGGRRKSSSKGSDLGAEIEKVKKDGEVHK